MEFSLDLDGLFDYVVGVINSDLNVMYSFRA